MYRVVIRVLLIGIATFTLFAAFPTTHAQGPDQATSARMPRTPSDVTPATGSSPHAPMGGSNPVQDGGFEGGAPNAAWEEFSSNFGSPLCSTATCGGLAPHGGTWHVWFGGTASTETAFMEQAVVIPAGTASLRFWLTIGAGGGTGSMTVLIDGNPIFTVTQTDAANYPRYTEVTQNISTYADGNSHVLRFNASSTGGIVNFFLDDVSIEVPTSVALSGFTAMPQEDAVALAWETASEFNTLGFNLYRSTDVASPVEGLNAELIASKSPGSGGGASYEWLDQTVEAGVTYYYWLEDVATNGVTTRHGPVSAVVAVPTSITLTDLNADVATPSIWLAAALGLTTLATLTLVRRRI